MIPLEQLSVYLPYKLEGVLTCNHEDDFCNQDWADLSKFQQGCIWQLAGYTDPDLNVPLGEGEYVGFLWRNEFTYVCFHSGIKPLLHPLSKINFDDLYEKFGSECDAYYDAIEALEVSKEMVLMMPYEIVVYLAKNHMDIFNWIGQGLAEPIK